MKKRWGIIAALFAVAFILWSASKPSTIETIPTDREIAWVGTLPAAVEEAKAKSQGVMVDFYADWCGPCKMLDEKTYADARVVDQATNWVSVKVDVDQEQDLAREYNVSSIPTIVFLNPEGKEISRFVGFADPEDMLEKMEAASKHPSFR